ncbi:unnamed protein product, partial [Meganyctiphanes norvegica]
MSSGFVTETQIEEKKRVRQENWDKNRAEDDPVEAPEEPEYDPRSLFDRLQEVKDKKQADYDEAHKFKNMVRGLEDDEVDFLELVDRTKLQEEKRVKIEESSAIAEYRKKVSEMKKKVAEEDMRAEMKASESRKPVGEKKTSQLSLLAGAIKRKSTSEEKSPEETDTKKIKIENTTKKMASFFFTMKKSKDFTCIISQSRLCVYVWSIHKDTDSDSEECTTVTSAIPRDITGRIIKAPSQCGGE